MASQEHLDFTYTTIDKIFRLSLGPNGDYSGARYEGDFSLSLEEAQRRKHQFIAEQLKIGPGSRVLDMGCGWGPFLTYAKNLGATVKGLTLSQGQAAACQVSGLDVVLKDCRQVRASDFGTFDAVVSVGAMEHFCSIEEFKAGKQDSVYADFFRNIAELLPRGKRCYIQTMVFGKNMIPLEEISLNAPKDSPAYALALMIAQFPGSWLPSGPEQVIENAKPHFKLVSISSGRLDYIETIGQWRKRFRAFNLQKYCLYATLIPKFLRDKSFRDLIAVFRVSPNRVCFEQETMEHYRMVFERI